jgi:hypothetical protein
MLWQFILIILLTLLDRSPLKTCGRREKDSGMDANGAQNKRGGGSRDVQEDQRGQND